MHAPVALLLFADHDIIMTVMYTRIHLKHQSTDLFLLPSAYFLLSIITSSV